MFGVVRHEYLVLEAHAYLLHKLAARAGSYADVIPRALREVLGQFHCSARKQIGDGEPEPRLAYAVLVICWRFLS